MGGRRDLSERFAEGVLRIISSPEAVFVGKNPFILIPKTNRLFNRTLTRKTRAKLLKVTRNRTVNSEISGRLFKATH